MSSSEPTFRLQYRAVRKDGGAFGQTESETSLIVIDGWDRPVTERSYGSIDVQLPLGVYRVRARLGATTNDDIIDLNKDVQQEIDGLRVRTPVPIHGSSYSHEYYRMAAAYNSRNVSMPSIGGAGPQGKLFVLVRGADKESASQVGVGLRITDAAGNSVAGFDDADAYRDEADGYAGVSTEARAGAYRLHIPGRPSRIVPIHVFDGFQTQAFLFDSGGVRPETLRVLFRRGFGFDAMDPDTRLADLAIDLMANLDATGRLEAPADDPKLKANPVALRLLAFDSVNLTNLLAGSYLGFHLGLPVPSAEGAPLGESADLQVLRLAAAVRSGEEVPDALRVPLNELPMFRYGLELALDLASTIPEIAPAGSMLDELAPNLLADSVWTAWTPETPGTDVTTYIRPLYGFLRGFPGAVGHPDTPPDTLPGHAPLEFTRRTSWVEHAIVNFGLEGTTDPAAIARKLRLPVATVERSFSRPFRNDLTAGLETEGDPV